MPEWERKKITLNNKIYYSVLYSNNSTKSTILFIHGLGSAKEDFLEAIQYPGFQNYNLLAVDLLGHGDSAKPKNFSYTMIDQAKNLKELLIHLSFDENIVIIAHSMGGPISIILAEMLNQKAKAIVYAEGNIDFGDCFGSNAIITTGNLIEWKNKNFQKMVDFLKAEINIEQSNYVVNFEKAGPETTYLSSRDLVEQSKKDNLIQRLINLDIPILPIFGEKNKGKFTSEEKIGKHFPIKYITDAEHDMMLSNPVEFYSFIREFLNTL